MSKKNKPGFLKEIIEPSTEKPLERIISDMRIAALDVEMDGTLPAQFFGRYGSSLIKQPPADPKERDFADASDMFHTLLENMALTIYIGVKNDAPVDRQLALVRIALEDAAKRSGIPDQTYELKTADKNYTHIVDRIPRVTEAMIVAMHDSLIEQGLEKATTSRATQTRG